MLGWRWAVGRGQSWTIKCCYSRYIKSLLTYLPTYLLSFIYRLIVNDCQKQHFWLPKWRLPNASQAFLIAIISILAIENAVFGNLKRKKILFTIAAHIRCVYISYCIHVVCSPGWHGWRSVAVSTFRQLFKKLFIWINIESLLRYQHLIKVDKSTLIKGLYWLILSWSTHQPIFNVDPTLNHCCVPAGVVLSVAKKKHWSASQLLHSWSVFVFANARFRFFQNEAHTSSGFSLFKCFYDDALTELVNHNTYRTSIVSCELHINLGVKVWAHWKISLSPPTPIACYWPIFVWLLLYVAWSRCFMSYIIVYC